MREQVEKLLIANKDLTLALSKLFRQFPVMMHVTMFHNLAHWLVIPYAYHKAKDLATKQRIERQFSSLFTDKGGK